MIETPFRFEAQFSDQEFQKIGRLSLRWSMIEHIIGNYLRIMQNLSLEEAVARISPLPLQNRLDQMKKLAKKKPLVPEAKAVFDELMPIMNGIRELRNHVAHAIIVEGELHSRRKQLSLALAEVFSAEELTNYAARLVETLRHALGSKDYEPGTEPGPLPPRPEVPEFLRRFIINSPDE